MTEAREDRKRELARERQRRRRDRLKAGKLIVAVEVDDVDLAAALTAEGVLDPQRDDDSQAIRAALEIAIARFTVRHA